MISVTRLAFYVKDFSVNLFSVPYEFDSHGTLTLFEPKNALKLKGGISIPFTRVGRAYHLKYEAPRANVQEVTSTAHALTTAKIKGVNEHQAELIKLWHRRMGHCSASVLYKLPGQVLKVMSRKDIRWLERENIQKLLRGCTVCPEAKMKSAPHPQNQEVKEGARKKRTYKDKMCTEFGERVSMDLAGPLIYSLA